MLTPFLIRVSWPFRNGQRDLALTRMASLDSATLFFWLFHNGESNFLFFPLVVLVSR